MATLVNQAEHRPQRYDVSVRYARYPAVCLYLRESACVEMRVVPCFLFGATSYAKSTCGLFAQTEWRGL